MPEPGENADLGDRLLGLLDRAARWPTRARTGPRLAVLFVLLALIAGLVLVVSDNVWRERIPRSTIAAIAIALAVLSALWLFGLRGSKVALSILTALGAIFIAAGTAFDWSGLLGSGPPPPGAVVDCPDEAEQGQFDGVVAPTEIGYAHLREEADLHSGIVVRYPPGCELAFDGYCLGEPKDDWRFDIQDPVWFRTAGGDGYVASADLKAGPAGGNVPSVACPGREPAPRRPEVTAPLRPTISGPVEFAAAVPEAIQVGFAVYYDDDPGPRDASSWHQIAVDIETGNGISARWDSRSVPGQSLHRAADVTLMAVPCNGLEFPSDRHTERAYVVANRSVPHLEAKARAPDPIHAGPAALAIACDNPDR